MEIRSVDRASYLALEHDLACCSTAPKYPVPISVSQSAKGFTGKTGKEGFVCVSLSEIKGFITSLKRLLAAPGKPSTVLRSLNINNNDLKLEVFKESDEVYILRSTLTKRYPCLENSDCELRSMVTFKIDGWTVVNVLISGFGEMC